MSRNINVNPGHYKVAGRERQGEGILQSSQKGAYTQQRQEARRHALESQAGPPAWETTPPNLEISDTAEPPASTKKRTRKMAAKKAGKKTGKRTQTAEPRRKAAGATSRSARSAARSKKSSTNPRRMTGAGSRKK